MSDVESRVNVHSKLTVVSSEPVGPGKTHRFSALDHAMGQHTLHIIFYYRNNPFDKRLINRIRGSLADLLCLYPPVTGRLFRGEDGNWAVKCNDAGVRTLRASVGTTLDEWLRSADGSEERDLTVWKDDMPDDPDIWSPFRIQINDFEEGGLAIGLSCTHLHADPTSAALFFKSWTDLNRAEPLAHPPVLIHPPALQAQPSSTTNTESKTYYATKPDLEVSPRSTKMATATFRFSNSTIKQCLAEVHDYCPNATPFDLLAALFWMRVARLNVTKNDGRHALSFSTDFRGLMNAPIPLGFFGNAVHFSLLTLDAETLGRGVLGQVTEIVHRHVVGLEEEEFRSVIDWLESRKGETGEYPPPFKMYGPELTCINTEHMIIPSELEEENAYRSLLYEAKFEAHEKPVHVSYHVGNVEGEGLIVVLPSPEEGLARTVMVTLPEDQIATLCEDQAILALEPTMLLDGRK
ncbi:protein ECERIFERUM 26-like [Cornus florida]|uniref:protein ECERIFERUM 26-like n=1 Tax=Cornus florida TaxID=4283 RepID=UPI00289A8BC3|nr:protein ECERIFERUM 26-like [Cornus florida]